jgi:hypothetical protein
MSHKKTIFSVSSNGALGGTFLEWSIHWLAGNDTYYHSTHGYIPLVSNPISSDSINAHNHRKNHPSGLTRTQKTLEKLSNLPDNTLCSLYPFALYYFDSAKLLNLTVNDQVDKDTLNLIVQNTKEDWTRTWEYLGSSKVNRIFIKLPDSLYLYYSSGPRSLEKQLFVDSTYSSADEHDDDLFNRFFKDSLLQYKNDMQIWDKRELLALTIPVEKNDDMYSGTDFTQVHKFINAQSLWHDGENTVLELMEYLRLPVNNDRLSEWRPVYQIWQQIQFKILNLLYDLDFIVEAVVNNYNFDLSKYNLSLYQEAIIQHKLMRQHNLTIKNWQLSKFPNNTKDLHALLEENFHTF